MPAQSVQQAGALARKIPCKYVFVILRRIIIQPFTITQVYSEKGAPISRLGGSIEEGEAT